ILKKLKTDLLGALGPDTKVVITVPAYFDEPRRKATADAGEMAGLSVLDIVNEPTAAALAFGETHGYLSRTGGATQEMTVLVFDLGGGTFDVTLLRLQPGDVRTLATDGDVQLGGHDWDMRLLDHAAESFKKTHGVDPREDPAAVNRLYAEVVEAKHTLSARNRAAIRINHAGRSGRIEVTRKEFEELTADLLERTAYTTRQLLSGSNCEWSRVGRVLLVGGATRMPMVGEMLQRMSRIAPDHTVNPDEAVARGAAVYASHLLAEQAQEGPGSPFKVTNVNSHGLGVEGIEQETLRKSNIVLIPRNTPLPAKFTERFVTKSAGQQSIVIQVLEGESSLPSECTVIGRTVIRDLPPGLPQGWPVEVTFEYGANGRLSVRGAVPGTHREVELKIERAVGLSGEKIARWQHAVGGASGFDAFETMLDDVLAAGGSGPQQATASQEAATPPRAATSPQPPPAARTARMSEPATAKPVAAPDGGAPASPPPASSPSRLEPTVAYAPPVAGDTPPVQAPPLPSGDQGAKQAAPASPTPPTGEEPLDWEPLEVSTRGPIPWWVINVAGFVTSAIVGLGLGYLLISWLFPDSAIIRFWE
ncbi:MAG: Hsp70 family protein, partial [Planctomycetes bacterium]|nr:Hsp70 family protein [Planctomycetota bacterium]